MILVIRNIQAYAVSAQQNVLVIGSPSPATICGAALALCRKIEIAFISVAFVIHEFKLNRGHPRFVPNGPDKPAASTIDCVTGDLRLSLLIELNWPEPDASDPMAMEHDAFQRHVIRTKVRRYIRNIAGGRVIEPPTLHDISLHDDQLTALRAVRHFGGMLLVDRSDLLHGFADPLARIISHLTIPSSGEKPVKGWLVPIHIGFQGIEPPTLRKADRKMIDETIPHSFAECITSLGEYVSLRRQLTLQDCFWRYCYDASERTYYVAARHQEIKQ
jgi:hypothetical protein